MESKYSKILIPVALVFIIMISVSCKREPIELGVKHGENVLTKEVFFSDPELGDITAIEVADSTTLTTPGIIIVGRLGSVLINEDGEVIDKTHFVDKPGLVVPVHDPAEQSFGYLNKGGGWQPVSYIDHSGKTVLSISEPTPNDAVLIDVDDDGAQDLVMGSNASGGLVAFDLEGERIWRKDAGNSFDVEIFEENEEKKIVHTDGDNILIRSKSGELERTLELPFKTFEKSFWPGRDKEAIIGMAQDSLQAFDLQGNKVGAYSIAREGRMAATAGFQDRQNQDHFGAVVSLLASTDRSEFYLFNSEDSLVFHEAIEAQYSVLTSLSMDNSEDLLLVGGSNGTVWGYSFR